MGGFVVRLIFGRRVEFVGFYSFFIGRYNISFLFGNLVIVGGLEILGRGLR